MTSANFSTYAIPEIVVDRDTRQRRELRGIDELAESIARLGLINPITITSEGVLVAGERRLTACAQLGWDKIPVQFAEDLEEYILQSIELEENVKRLDLTWQEEVEALARFHELKQSNEEEWSQQDTADALGYSSTDVSRRLAVAAEMDNSIISTADRFSTAHNMVQRNAERKKSSAEDSVAAVLTNFVKPAPVVSADPDISSILDKSEAIAEETFPILNTSFHDWQPTYDGPKFNLIHCDFPYGINVADSPRMLSGILDHYEDSPDIYWSLLARLALAMENVVAESAHLIFWHSFKFHADTKVELERMGWTVNPFPLIWHKTDNAGVAPDPQRWPRQTYEAAFIASRGDRKLTDTGTRSNSFGFPGKRKDSIHVSEKPYKMLTHFLSMYCDEYSYVLDPTAGSCNALKVAEDLGAERVLGLEQDEQFFNTAKNNWEKRE